MLAHFTPHCKDKIPKFRNKYSQKRNIVVSVPVSTFMRLRAIYIFPRSVCLFCWRKYVDRSWDYINRSQKHECWNWGWGHAIPRKGIHTVSGIFVAVQAVTGRLVRNLMVKSGSEKQSLNSECLFYENEKEGRGYGSCARKSFGRNYALTRLKGTVAPD
jgi:hypothetical protein